MSLINITLKSPLLPEGTSVEAELNVNSIEKDIEATKKAVTYVFEEAARSAGLTPAERILSERLDAIDRALLNQLPADVKLEIANRTSGK